RTPMLIGTARIPIVKRWRQARRTRALKERTKASGPTAAADLTTKVSRVGCAATAGPTLLLRQEIIPSNQSGVVALIRGACTGGRPGLTGRAPQDFMRRGRGLPT